MVERRHTEPDKHLPFAKLFADDLESIEAILRKAHPSEKVRFATDEWNNASTAKELLAAEAAREYTRNLTVHVGYASYLRVYPFGTVVATPIPDELASIGAANQIAEIVRASRTWGRRLLAWIDRWWWVTWAAVVLAGLLVLFGGGDRTLIDWIVVSALFAWPVLGSVLFLVLGHRFNSIVWFASRSERPSFLARHGEDILRQAVTHTITAIIGAVIALLVQSLT